MKKIAILGKKCYNKKECVNLYKKLDGMGGNIIMKKQKLGVLLLTATLGLSGCGGYIELTDKQNAEAAEYIGGLLLKYSSNYDNSLIYPDEVVVVEDTKEKETEEENENSASKTDSESGSVSLGDLFGVSSLQVKVTDTATYKEYTQKNNSSYAIYANKGKKLVVVNLQLKNTSSNSKKVKLLTKGITYKLITANGTSYDAQRTMLFEDLNFYNEKIEAGKKKQGVLVFEVPEKTKIASSQLKAEGAKGTVTEVIK